MINSQRNSPAQQQTPPGISPVSRAADLPIEAAPEAPLVTIVVIGYNQQVFIERALRSALNQTHRHLECIFVDDGSNDRTHQIAQSLADADRRLRVVRQENAGPGSARRRGALLADPQTSYIGFLDGDDIYFPEFITYCLRYFRQHADVDVIVPGFGFVDAHDSPMPTQARTRWARSPWGLPYPIAPSTANTPFITFYCGSAGVPFWLAPKSVYDQIEGWDSSFWPYEDTDILAQFALRFTVHMLQEPLVGFRVHAQQSTKQGSQRSRHWKGNSLELMQAKWNRKAFNDPHQAHLVDKACLYYRRIHLPLRSLYIAKMAWSDFANSPSISRLRWLGFLMTESVVAFLYFRIFFWRAKRSWNPDLR